MIIEDMPTLSWMGRKEATNATKDVVMKILREDKSLSYAKEISREERGEQGEPDDLFSRVEVEKCRNGRGTRPACPQRDNILVHGDNLEALHALLPFYAGRVKCIYIDPPYNTGSAFEHYDDNLEHSTWLSLMYSRLKLLREFLSDDGSIWISIDDDEQAYLKVICDEIFGRQNFMSTITWQRAYSAIALAKNISRTTDFILVYAANSSKLSWNKLPRTEEANKRYRNPDNDIRGPWKTTDSTAQAGHGTESQFYDFVAPNGRVHKLPAGRCWLYTESAMDKMIADNRVWFGESGNNVPAIKRFLSEVSSGMVAQTLWTFEDVGHTQESKKEIKALQFDSIFATPKPERLIQRILTIATNPGDLVLDSFLGSGTTTAVAQKMGRRWIGIEMGEHAKTHCAVRLKKVIDGEQGGISKAVKWQGGGSFRYYELGEAILKKDGTLTENIPFETMAAHVWFTQTKRPYGKVEKVGAIERSEIAERSVGLRGEWKKSTFLGVHEDVAYALLYNGILGDKRVSGGNVLTKKTLKIIRDDMDSATTEEERGQLKALVIYGEASRLADETLKSEKIDFRQTPYDLVTRK